MSIELNPALLPPGPAARPAAPPAAAPAGAPASGRTGTAGAGRTGPAPGPAFAEVLEQASGTRALHFSKHALQRVQRRGIALDHPTLKRLEDGVHRAAGKGARSSVVLVDGTAFVVSVNNRTVLTAVGPEHMREHVFTNIDSAVLA